MTAKAIPSFERSRLQILVLVAEVDDAEVAEDTVEDVVEVEAEAEAMETIVAEEPVATTTVVTEAVVEVAIRVDDPAAEVTKVVADPILVEAVVVIVIQTLEMIVHTAHRAKVVGANTAYSKTNHSGYVNTAQLIN